MLFNKSDTGITEAKQLIPFIYESMDFANLEIDIRQAESDIKKLIGNDVYLLADEFYHSSDYDQPDDSGSASETHRGNDLLTLLVQKIQLPVIIHAYKSYAANNLVSHSDKGRQIIVTETEKPAFEWQIKRDEAALLQKEFKALDDLIEFLDTYIDYFPEWSESDAYTQSKELFINSAKEFDQYFPIDSSRRLFIKICPFIKEVERKYIRPTISPAVFNDIKTKIRENNLDDSDQILLEYIQQPLALLTMSIALKRLAVEVLPEGVFQNQYTEAVILTTKDKSSDAARREVMTSLEEEGKKELSRLEFYLKGLTYDSGSEIFEIIPPQHTPTDTYFRV